MTTPNPFATRFTEPGSLPFFCGENESLDGWIRRFRDLGGRAQIVGPHGCGKTTLLESLLVRIFGRVPGVSISPLRVALHDRQRRLPPEFWTTFDLPHRQVVVDGYEQLGLFERLRLCRRCPRLLVTTHRRVRGFPVLVELQPDVARFLRLVRKLYADPAFASDEELRNVFDRHGGNIRNAFFELYDRFEETVAADRLSTG